MHQNTLIDAIFKLIYINDYLKPYLFFESSNLGIALLCISSIIANPIKRCHMLEASK